MGEKWITVELIIRYTFGVGVSFSWLLILCLSSLRFAREKSSGFAQGDIAVRGKHSSTSLIKLMSELSDQVL